MYYLYVFILYPKQPALVQERDELLALLDIQEREQYNSLHPQSSEDQPFSEYSTAEVSV